MYRYAVVASPLPRAGVTRQLPFKPMDFFKSVEMLKWAETAMSANIESRYHSLEIRYQSLSPECTRHVWGKEQSDWLKNMVNAYLDKKYLEWTVKQNEANDLS
jgi:hypothetical protein